MAITRPRPTDWSFALDRPGLPPRPDLVVGGVGVLGVLAAALCGAVRHQPRVARPIR